MNPTAAIVVLKHPKDKNLFLAYSRKNNFTDLGFPGGSIKENENGFMAALREFFEETAYNLANNWFYAENLYTGKDESGVVVQAWLFELLKLIEFPEFIPEPGHVVCWATKEQLTSGSFKIYNQKVFDILESRDAEVDKFPVGS